MLLTDDNNWWLFPLHPNTFHQLFYNHTLPSIENLKSLVTCFTSNISGVASTQIKSLRQFQSTISQFKGIIDSDIPSLNSNIEYITKFNSFVTKCVKSYLCNYITCISKHYNSCYNSLKWNIETFKCIQSCVKTMETLVNVNTGSERYVKGLFSYISDNNYVKNTITMITGNYPSKTIDKINIYLNALANSEDASDYIDTTIWQLDNIKDYLSEFSLNIANYNTRIRGFIIRRLSGLTKTESTISRINENGIKDKYQTIKHKVEYCKTSLEFEVQRLESISKNAKMLQKHLEMLIEMINKYKTIEDNLKEFKEKLNEVKQNKYRIMNYLKWLVRSIETNLCKIQPISNSLNSAKHRVSIATIKQDLDNINTRINDMNNILSVVRSQLTLLRPVNFGFDLSPICEVESCVQNIVCGIHLKYCCLSSNISGIFFGQPSSLSTLGRGCQLSELVECTCSTQASTQICDGCVNCQSDQGCPSCECIKKLLSSCNESDTEKKLKYINKVISQLINGKRSDGCHGTQNTNSCETSQQGRTGNTCQTTIRELIKSTLNEIKQCEQSSQPTCQSAQDIKCSDTGSNSCQVTSGPQSTTSCPSSSPSPGVLKCNELDKVKLCLDTLVNKCNCCNLKELVNVKKLKSCFDVFKWIFIYNFRELFCLYLSFDKSILDYISCIMEKLEQMKFDLRGIISIHTEINEIPKQFQILENTMKSGIRELECAIEGVSRNPIRCSLQSNFNSMVSVMNDNLGVVELHSQVVGMYSMSNVMDYEVLVNRLYDSAKKIDQILQLVPWREGCQCIFALEWLTSNRMILENIYLYNIINNLATKTKDELDKFLGLDKITRIRSLGIDQNHLCLCMVIKYVLYPAIIKLIDIIGIDLDSLSSISRKFQKYTHNTSQGSQAVNILVLIVEVLVLISKWVRNKYRYTMSWTHTGNGIRVDVTCFCMYSDDPNYSRVISLILVISSLIESMWSMDTESTRMSIEKLSVLYSQLEIYDFKSIEDSKKVCCNPVYWLLVNKECQKKGEKCCCCWCPAAVNVLVMCISLSIQCKLCNALCTKKQKPCEKWKEFCEVQDCDCKCPEGKGLCCLLKLAACSQTSGATAEGCKSLEELLKECKDENGCCKKLLEKSKNGLCKVLLLGCECDCTQPATDCQVKVWCVFFNNPGGSSSVAVVVFCKFMTPTNECCCLYTLIGKLEPKLKKICNGDDCVCKELENVCDQICGIDCGSECVCKTLKDTWNKICNGDGTGECLCKLIKETLSNLCKKGICPCSKPGNNCCKCPCCKIVAHAIKILTRACKQNMMEPYKRIAIDLMTNAKDKPQLVRNIVNRINNGIVNRIYLLKNNLLTHPNYEISMNPLNTVKSRNWGYDTQYELQPTHNSLGDV